MTPDPIIDALHQLRERKAAALNNDLCAMAADARHRQANSGHPVVTYAPQPPRSPLTESGKPGTKRAG